MGSGGGSGSAPRGGMSRDEHTRECLGGLVERNITGDDLINELDRVAAVRGYPAVLRCDNAPELACVAMAA
jgi:putative transposase